MKVLTKKELVEKIKELYGGNSDYYNFVEGWILGYCETIEDFTLQDYLTNYNETYYQKLSK